MMEIEPVHGGSQSIAGKNPTTKSEVANNFLAGT